MSIDLVAMWIGYALMIGSASLLAGYVFCWGLYALFWRTPEETLAFLKFIRWRVRGKPRTTPPSQRKGF